MSETIKDLELKYKKLQKEKKDRLEKKELQSKIKELENEKKPSSQLKKLGKDLWNMI